MTDLQWGKYPIKEFKDSFSEVVVFEYRDEWNGYVDNFLMEQHYEQREQWIPCLEARLDLQKSLIAQIFLMQELRNSLLFENHEKICTTDPIFHWEKKEQIQRTVLKRKTKAPFWFQLFQRKGREVKEEEMIKMIKIPPKEELMV